jgi:hypothetical protein
MTSRGLRSPYGSDHSGRAGIFERQLIPVGSGITNSGLAEVRGVPVDGATGVRYTRRSVDGLGLLGCVWSLYQWFLKTLLLVAALLNCF